MRISYERVSHLVAIRSQQMVKAFYFQKKIIVIDLKRFQNKNRYSISNLILRKTPEIIEKN